MRISELNPMVLNCQNRVRVDVGAAAVFAGKVRRALKLGRRGFGVCFLDDVRIAQLNGRYRKKPRPTDVLSFRWAQEVGGKRSRRRPGPGGEFERYLGDIVISAETARRNARAAGHSTAREIRWLILHGALHLVGYDHETDQGEMTAMELGLRDRLRA